MKTSSSPRGWHSRGYLPHFDGGEICQFITLHLGDALPKKVLEKWKRNLDFENDEYAKQLLYERINKYLDQGYGSCWLNRPDIAAIAEESLLRWDSIRYRLLSWVIMPNHTHFLIKPIEGFPLSKIMKNHKSFTSHSANKVLKRNGQFWQEDYFDRYIRDHDHYVDTIRYIEMNPVKAGFCKKPEDWRFGSARLRLQNS
ncbi:MAG: transposase [Acidobacteriota bacterium]|nr:transposase [Acidobacteriota bacterium]